MIHLTEAVAKRTSGKYGNRFPYNPDTIQIIQFIESKGFTIAKNPTDPRVAMSPRDLVALCRNRPPRYTVGPCIHGEPGTFWVAICGGDDDTVWICRTDEGISKETANLPGGLFRKTLPNGKYVEYLTYEVFREQICKYFDWK